MSNKKCIRRWDANYDFALVAGDYQRAALLTKQFIKQKIPLAELFRILREKDFSYRSFVAREDWDKFYLNQDQTKPQLELSSYKQKYSRSGGRYYVPVGTTIHLNIKTNLVFKELFPGFIIKWRSGITKMDDSLCIEDSDAHSPQLFNLQGDCSFFHISTDAGHREYEKIFMVICDEQKLVGFYRYFFSAIHEDQ